MDTTTYSSLQKRLDVIHDVGYESPGLAYIKGRKGRYLYVNRNEYLEAGFSKSEDMLGKSDLDVAWGEFAPALIENDHVAMNHNRLVSTYEVALDLDGVVKVYISQKKAFYHDNTLMGVQGNSLLVPLSLLKTTPVFRKNSQFIDVKLHRQLVLTERQKEVLYHLLQGDSAKAVAERLQLSYRTVEHHIELIKDNNEYASMKDILLQVRVV